MIGLAKELPKHEEKYELHRLLGALLSQDLTKLSKNSPTSSGSEMNCGAEHKCSKESCK